MKHFLFAAICLLGFGLGLTSCQSVSPPPAPPKPVYQPGSYEYFLLHCKGYPKTMEIYLNDGLFMKADGRNCRVAICLDQQRGRLYVTEKIPAPPAPPAQEGTQLAAVSAFMEVERVAADWPVSTGVDKRETPTGNYRIRLKKKEHSSNRYGKMFNAEGKCINYDADAFKDPVPEGGRFEGAEMPNWMRLTADGVGMHTGKVRAGRRLSHGCIRTPGLIANKLFEVTKVGTRVSITQGFEPQFPGHDALAQKAQKEAEEAARAAEAKARAQAEAASMKKKAS